MQKEGFYAYLQFEKRYSLNTIEAYRNDISQFSAFLLEQYPGSDPDLTDVHHKQIRTWIVTLMNDKMTAKSVNRKISSLKTYFKYLLRTGAVTKNPMLKVVAPKTPKNLPLLVEKGNMENVFDNIDNIYPENTEVERFIKIRDLLIIELLYSTGMRRTELLNLTDNSFDRSQRNVKVLGKGNKERIIPISKDLLQLIDTYLSSRNKLFSITKTFIITETGKKPYPKMIYNIVNKVLQFVTTLTRKSPHVLRHTFATHLSNNGAELNAIKELLGHASLASTQVYTHNTIDQLKNIHHLAHPKG